MENHNGIHITLLHQLFTIRNNSSNIPSFMYIYVYKKKQRRNYRNASKIKQNKRE